MGHFSVALAGFLLVVGGGTAIALPAYARLLRCVREDHPEDYEAMGRPTLWMASPEKSLVLQRYIYSHARGSLATPRVFALCRFLAVFTPLLVIGSLGTAAWLAAASYLAAR